MIRKSVLAWMLVGSLAACTGDPIQQAGIPGTSAAATMELLAERGPHYLDVLVTTGGREWRFFVPTTEECRALLGREGLRYVQLGPLGSIRSDQGRCDPNGILSLAQWRDRSSRSRPAGIPSGRVAYEIIFRDEDLGLALGRFPLVGFLGWTGGERTIAVIPNTDECKPVLERSNGTIEYRASGRVALSIVTPTGRCALLGLARPN